MVAAAAHHPLQAHTALSTAARRRIRKGFLGLAAEAALCVLVVLLLLLASSLPLAASLDLQHQHQSLSRCQAAVPMNKLIVAGPMARSALPSIVALAKKAEASGCRLQTVRAPAVGEALSCAGVEFDVASEPVDAGGEMGRQ